MGVPGFFSWLLKCYKNKTLILNNINVCPDILYIDANCLFHPQCYKILENDINEHHIDILENKMVIRIIKYIDYLIDYVNPTNMVYVAVDGVAPLAKINQQRKRRYRTIDDFNIKDKIKEKYKIKYNNSWNNTVITPGTNFMEFLHIELYKHFKKSTRKIIYSSYHTVGEGEHKILQHIKKNKNLNKNIIIYGLDADLFFLAMASQINNIYLLREASQFTNDDDNNNSTITEVLRYISIDMIKNLCNKTIITTITRKQQLDIDKLNFCNDFIFICYLLGNDFLPHLPSLNIKNAGMDYILDAYSDVYIELKEQLIENNNKNINNDFLRKLLKILGDYESSYFIYELQNYKRYQQNKIFNPAGIKNADYKKELWELENMKLMTINDPIKLGWDCSDLWKFRYYEHYFQTIEYQNEMINIITEYYIQGLKWVTEYYFDSCIDWKWQLPYAHAPFVSDLAKFLETNNINNYKFTNISPITPYEQLLSVVPPSCINIIPKSYQKLMIDSNIIDMFPHTFELDMIDKDQYWQCIPIIPALDIQRILNETTKIKLLKNELNNNMICNEFTFNL